MMTANQHEQFVRAARAMDLGYLVDDPRFCNDEVRSAHGVELGGAPIGPFGPRNPPSNERLFAATHVPAAKVRTVPEVLSEAHLAQRGNDQAGCGHRFGPRVGRALHRLPMERLLIGAIVWPAAPRRTQCQSVEIPGIEPKRHGLTCWRRAWDPNQPYASESAKERKKKPGLEPGFVYWMVGPVGFEPTTYGLRVRCSTN